MFMSKKIIDKLKDKGQRAKHLQYIKQPQGGYYNI